MSRASAARIARRGTYSRDSIVRVLQEAQAEHAATFMAVVGATSLVPEQCSAEDHARFQERTRQIQTQIAELMDEHAVVVAAYLGINGGSS